MSSGLKQSSAVTSSSSLSSVPSRPTSPGHQRGGALVAGEEGHRRHRLGEGGSEELRVDGIRRRSLSPSPGEEREWRHGGGQER
jgi:hypothetical protein